MNTTFSGMQDGNTLNGWAAFDAARKHGFRMIPSIPGAKDKYFVKWGPYQSQDVTDAEVAQWKRQFPKIDPVLMTGAPSGVVVLDQDGIAGYITLKKLEIVPVTVTVSTSRATYHKHYYLKCPTDLGYIHGFVGGYDEDLPSVDLKADGGLARFPGASHPDGGLYAFDPGYGPDEIEIAPLPGWLYAYIKSHNDKLARQEAERLARIEEAEREQRFRTTSVVWAARERQGLTDGRAARMKRYAEAAKRNQLDKLRSAPSGARNVQLNNSAYALAPFLHECVWTEAELERDLEMAAIECGLGDDPDCGLAGIRKTIRSGIRAGSRNRVVLPAHPTTFGARAGMR